MLNSIEPFCNKLKKQYFILNYYLEREMNYKNFITKLDRLGISSYTIYSFGN